MLITDKIDLIFSTEFYDKQTFVPVKFNLAVDIIDKCNYRCYYCYNNNVRTYKQLDLNKLYMFSLFLIDKNPQLKLSVQILGGEPTLHPQLDEFIDLCYACSTIQCVLFSNFSASVDKYVSYLQKNVQLNLSCHLTNNFNYGVFLNKLQKLPQIFFDSRQINIIVLYDCNKWEQSIDVFQRLLALYPQNVSLPMLMDNQNFVCNYSPNMYEQYDNAVYANQNYINQRRMYELVVKRKEQTSCIQREKISDIRSLEYRQFYHYLCDAGQYSLYIHNDGYVYACEAYYDLHKPLCTVNHFSSLRLKQTLCECHLCGCAENAKKLRVFIK